MDQTSISNLRDFVKHLEKENNTFPVTRGCMRGFMRKHDNTEALKGSAQSYSGSP